MADFIKKTNKGCNKFKKYLFIVLSAALIMMCFCSCSPEVKFSGCGKTSPSVEDVYADAGKYTDKEVEIAGTVKHISAIDDYGFLFVYFKDGDNTWRIRVHKTNINLEKICAGCKVWLKGKCEGATKNDDGTVEVHIYSEQFVKGN